MYNVNETKLTKQNAVLKGVNSCRLVISMSLCHMPDLDRDDVNLLPCQIDHLTQDSVMCCLLYQVQERQRQLDQDMAEEAKVATKPFQMP